ncbi:MAG: hypothetical protein A2234_04495 [Elusimicrobia bacterium RIFOXYA2_FULL_58_8]|nr:MAG: hypothetical protein A2234_04495 [Elusimicrobia bacterium RIFOXYA2_FULL_58_8]
MSLRWKLAAVCLLPLLLLTVAAAALADDHPRIDPAQGWQSLFNGKDLSGWVQRDVTAWKPRPGTWAVEDGVITRKGSGYLVSEKTYGDFILDLEFKVAEKTNSGVFLRHPAKPGVKPYWRDGALEIQILNSWKVDKPTMHDCGSLYDMQGPAKNTMKKPGQWNRMTMTAQGSRIEVVLNGAKILAADLDRWTEAGKNPDGTPCKYAKPMKDMPRTGYIMLQDHGTPVWFRNIFVKELTKN